ncbi:MAG: pro-sigmaK processing inhibitor BofA family protein [bacterium]|nr:pro-sigmaK processing inhibitor BofA family protein [bacterium]
MKKVFEILKKVVLSFVILYSYNLIAVNFNMIIPINLFTVLIVSILGAPALLALILFKITNL